jgi:transcriptional regulator with XRE-family HTH domain
MSGLFAENFERILGLHRLTARDASKLLDITPATLSYWRNGRREPDRDSLMRVSTYFAIDPWALVMTPFVDLLPILANRERFELVELRIAEGARAADLDTPRARQIAVVREVERGMEQAVRELEREMEQVGEKVVRRIETPPSS